MCPYPTSHFPQEYISSIINHTQTTAQVCNIQVCKHNSTGVTDAAESLGVGVSDKGLVGVCEVAQRRPTECQVQSERGGTAATPVLCCL